MGIAPPLLKEEGNASRSALIPDVASPIRMHLSRVRSRLAAKEYRTDAKVVIINNNVTGCRDIGSPHKSRKINGRQHRLQRQESISRYPEQMRDALVCPLLVFAGDAMPDIWERPRGWS